MRKLFASLLFFPSLAWGWMGAGGGNDYSRDTGNMFYCANPAGTSVVTQAGLSRFNSILTLVNPPGSGKNAVLLEVRILPGSASSLTNFMLAYSTGAANVIYSTGTTVTFDLITYSTMTTVIPAKIFNSVPSTTTVAAMSLTQCYRGATLGNLPVAFRYIGVASTQTPTAVTDSIDGRVVVPPGTTISIQTSAVISAVANFLWREEPL